MMELFTDIWHALEKKEQQYLKAGLFVIIIIGCISIFLLPFVFTRPAIFKWMDLSDKSGAANTIYGISAPFIALLGAILTFFAFYIQYKANNQQRTQFQQGLDSQRSQFEKSLEFQKQQFEKSLENQNLQRREQEKTWQIERFENRFYELLKLHKENVAEINITGYHSQIDKRKAFVSMFNEFRFCYSICWDVYDELINKGQMTRFSMDEIDDQTYIVELAYTIFFNGITSSFDLMIDQLNTDFDATLLNIIKDKLELAQKKHVEYFSSKNYKDINPVYDLYYPKPSFKFELNGTPYDLNIKYKPFTGHVSRLGHYYRHLFQTVKFVVSQKDLIGEEVTNEYLKTLRAQLSNHEQLMLYYNAIGGFGQPWIDKGYFTTYRMIHNLPLHLAKFAVDPTKRFEREIEESNEGKPMFEEYE